MSALQLRLNPTARKPFVDHTTASFCFIVENFKSVQECASMNLKPSAPRAAFTTEEHSAASNSTADPTVGFVSFHHKYFKAYLFFFLITEKWRTVPRRVKLWSLLFCIFFFWDRVLQWSPGWSQTFFSNLFLTSFIIVVCTCLWWTGYMEHAEIGRQLCGVLQSLCRY